MSTAIQTEIRTTKTKAELRQLRANGKIPGVVYGSKVGSVSITVDEKAMRSVLSQRAHAVLQLELPEQGKHSVIIADIQRDALIKNPIHIDFQQLNMNEELRTTIPVEFLGDPAGIKVGGIRTVISDQVEVRCLPEHLPSSFQIDISALEIGDSVSVEQLTVPEHVTIMTDPQEVLLSITTGQKEVEEEAAPEDAASEEASS